MVASNRHGLGQTGFSGRFGVLLIALACTSSALTLGRPAQSAPATATADATAKEQARALLIEGNELTRKGDFVPALKRYRAAYELFPSPNLLLNIGTTLRHLGRDAEAATTYEEYIAHPQAEPQMVATVQQLLSEIEGLVARLTIALNVADAKVRVDGRLLSERAARTTVRVDPGEHTIVAEKQGRQPAVRSVTVGAGEHSTVTLSLATPGEHPADGSAQRIVAYSMGGLALAGFGVGAVFGGLFLSSKTEADDHCDAIRCDAQGSSAVAEAQDQGMVANVTLIASALVAASAIVVYLTAPSDTEPEPDTQVALTVGGGGLALTAHW